MDQLVLGLRVRQADSCPDLGRTPDKIRPLGGQVPVTQMVGWVPSDVVIVAGSHWDRRYIRYNEDASTIMNFPIKRLADGRALLNIGCGTRTNRSWTNVDFSPYARLAHHALAARLLHGTGLLSDLRYERLQHVDPEIVCCLPA